MPSRCGGVRGSRGITVIPVGGGEHGRNQEF